MTFEIIKSHLSSSDLKSYQKGLGYKSSHNVVVALEKFQSAPSLEVWLDSGFYDLTHNPKSLVKALARMLKLDNERLNQEILAYDILITEIERFKDSFIVAETNFKRTGEGLMSMGHAATFKRINLYGKREVLFCKVDEIMVVIKKLILQHHDQYIDGLPVFGKITSYYAKVFDQYYSFDTEGNLIKN